MRLVDIMCLFQIQFPNEIPVEGFTHEPSLNSQHRKESRKRIKNGTSLKNYKGTTNLLKHNYYYCDNIEVEIEEENLLQNELHESEFFISFGIWLHSFCFSHIIKYLKSYINVLGI